jgi:hypothetical protein
MAADILLYQAAIVPVGDDQSQHLELTRDIAQRFNSLFGETFTLPKYKVLESSAKVPGTDGEKMSKSYNNTIEIFEEVKAARKKVMRITTDSRPRISRRWGRASPTFEYLPGILRLDRRRNARALSGMPRDLKAGGRDGGRSWSRSEALPGDRLEPGYLAGLREGARHPHRQFHGRVGEAKDGSVHKAGDVASPKLCSPLLAPGSRQPNFRRLWLAQVVSELGDWFIRWPFLICWNDRQRRMRAWSGAAVLPRP